MVSNLPLQQLPFSYFLPIRICVITFTIISLFSSVATSLTYVCLWFNNRKHAQRLTLQYVMVAVVALIVVEILDIVNWTVAGNSDYCENTSVVIMAFNTVAVSALGTIGLNLMIILYGDMRKQKWASRFYPLGIISFSLIACSATIHQITTNDAITNHYSVPRSCWYYSRHFYSPTKIGFHWLWYYCFLFLIIVSSAVFGGMSMWKLSRDYRLKEPTTQDSSSSSSVFFKVGIRCILYSLVPIVTNVWAFIMQFVEFEPQRSSYPLSIVDAIFSSAAGLLVAAIFYSEPTTVAFIKDIYHHQRKSTPVNDNNDNNTGQVSSSTTTVEAGASKSKSEDTGQPSSSNISTQSHSIPLDRDGQRLSTIVSENSQVPF
ncbi:uncharacterized protein BX664DRAFT_338225 [Halteromyces radiatus]|uniref:uncharacterized protein n=1 Tax=Halteromyces radiatus TaxID=101107 RepID=UPI0022210643|nr:uncharacterized protein BX664DRAFT_338225 [Halteromyces radiatus]KAI8084971.1 hypothetical protein BX664DRAFT_338225 [Halteromyces radiatus]